MSDLSQRGVLYTEYSGLRTAGVASLWSYEGHLRDHARRPISTNADGNLEYWLEPFDPLLNTILPGTWLSLVVNLGSAWAAGRSLATTAILPRVSVIGPVTQARILLLGESVRAVGVGFPPMMAPGLFGVPASELVDRILPLDDLWNRDVVDNLLGSVSVVDIRRAVTVLKDEVLKRIVRQGDDEIVGRTAPQLIERRCGQVSIDAMAKTHGLSRQQFARRFAGAAGLPPKIFARIVRFQSLVHALLSSDVSDWASVSSAAGFYDQAHMINEFRSFAGSPPTVFFRPHDPSIDPARIKVRGRPSEWLRRPEVGEAAATNG